MEPNKIIDYPIDYNQYLDVKDILEHYSFWDFDKLVLITDNGTGKTYTATNWVMETLIAGKNACWIRNTELEADKCVNGLTAGLKRYGITDKFVCKKEGVYEVTDWTSGGKPKTIVLRCPIVYLSSLAKSVPQEIHAELIVIDEFIDGSSSRKFVLKDYAGDLKKAISRLIRPVDPGCKVTTLALANPHEPTSDLLQALGIDFDWDLLATGQPSYSYNTETHTVGICIPKQFNIQAMESTYCYWNGESGVKENYHFLPNKFKRVHHIDDDCVDYEGRLAVSRQFFAYGTWKDADGNRNMYIRKCDAMDFSEFICYAVTPIDVFNDAVWLENTTDRVDRLYKLVKFIMSNKLYYDCDFTREKIKEVNRMILAFKSCGY
jgi:hypothetical protein